MTSKYNSKFYESRHDHTRYSAKVILSIVQELVHPSSAVDLGCGVGTWLKVLEESGVEDILGIEGSWVKDEAIVIPLTNFMKADVARPIQLDRQFDLAISLEVAEHIEERNAEQFLDNLTALAPVILFSAAIPLQGGAHHVNEKWPEYWKEKFARRNFLLLDCIRPKVWNDPLIAVWYAQNSFMYVRNDKFDNFPRLSPYKESNLMLSVVHPRFYENHLMTWPVMRALRNRIARMFT